MKLLVPLGLFAALIVPVLLRAAEAESSLPSVKTLATSFETSAKPWTIPVTQSLASKTLAVPAGSAWDFRAARNLFVKAERLKAGGVSARLRWLVTSRVGGLYLGPSVPLPVGGTAVPAINFAADAAELTPVGHLRPWDALAAAEVIALELRVENSTGALKGEDLNIKLSGVRIEAGAAASVKPTLLDLALEPAPAGSRAAVTLTFRIDPLPADPYAATGDGDVRIKLPGDRQALAFLDQDYIAQDDGAAMRMVPVGLPRWRAFLPERPNGSIQIASGKNSWTISSATLNEIAASRTSEKSGVPSIGVRPPLPPESGLGLESKAIPRARWQTPLEAPAPALETNWTGSSMLWTLAKSGIWRPLDSGAETSNVFQARGSAVALWRPVPFWNASWGGYAGVRRPDSWLARQMDLLLETAALEGRSQPLAVLDGGALERQGVFNWASHPLRGKLAGPGELFRTEEGFDFCARWMRYCLARYAHSKAVSALLLTSDLNAPGAPEFHARIAPLLKDWTQGTCSSGAVPLISFHPLAQSPKTVKDIGSFDHMDVSQAPSWRVDQRLGRAMGHMLEKEGLGSSHCFELRAIDSSTTAVAVASDWRKPSDDNFFGCQALMFEVWTPPNAPPDLRIGVHLRDRDGQWFQALLPGMVRPGDWTSYALDLTAANAHKLVGVNHKKAWTDYSRQRISEIGLHIYSTHPGWSVKGLAQNLSARFDNIRGVLFAPAVPEPKLEIALFDPSAQIILSGSRAEIVPIGTSQAVSSRPATPATPGPVPTRGQVCERGALVEYHLKINKAFANPFDIRDCDLNAIVTTPSGKKVRVPAFFDQLCERREETPGGNEIVEPVGEEFFTIRYRALETGTHAIAFELREGGRFDVKREWEDDPRFTPDGDGQSGQSPQWQYTAYPRQYENGRRPIDTIKFVPGQVTAALDLGANALTVSESAKPFHGFVRVAGDQRHFQFDDGTFFYPLGPCLRSPSDTRVPYSSPKFNPEEIDRLGKRGTYQYDDYFSAFGKAGITWARVWMCSWWGALEWRRDWPGYQGLGRYNLLNAWRIDYILNLAEKSNVHLNLALTNHGQFTLNIDTEWKHNPYNVNLGGPLHAPCEIFTRAEGKIAHENKLRYVAARYGHSPNVMAFALFSELEFTEEYDRKVRRGGEPDLPAPHMEAWHAEMASFLKSVDPNRHMVSTHFSHPERGAGTLSVPEIDIATSNAYSAFQELADGSFDAAAALHDFWHGNRAGFTGFKVFDKPALVEEQGRHWMGMDGGRETNTKSELDADLHAGLWGSMVQPLSGATGYWWWLHVHFDNRYGDYHALAKFIEGEDFRPLAGEPPMESSFISIGKTPLRGRAMKSDRRIFAWIYHQQTPFGDEQPEDVAGALLKIGSLKAGKYCVEFWDTYKGERTGSVTIEMSGDKTKPVTEIKLPVVKRDIALKIKPVL